MSEPMSAERLARIRERAVRAACGKHKDDGWLFCRIDAPDLLAEVERLRTAEESLAVENARLRAELEAAKGDLHELAQCVSCKHSYAKGIRCQIPSKKRISSRDGKRCYTWEWRGVCPANTPAQGATDETRGGGEG